MSWVLGGKVFSSRFLLGTAHYPTLQCMEEAIGASQAEIITVSLKRQLPEKKGGNVFWEIIKGLKCQLLPNTAGCREVEDAINLAEMAREIFQTHWIKLEIIGDDYNLQPDPFKLVRAAEELIHRGFEVFPYCTEDLIVCRRLIECGCRVLMPWGSPIGSGKGLLNPYGLETLRVRFPEISLIIDAGLGCPSHAARAMELGYDGVLLNSAVSLSANPVGMAMAFREAIRAGRMAFQAGMMVERNMASPSTALIDTPFWHQKN